MSKVDTFFGYAEEYDTIPAEQQPSVSPSWQVHNIPNLAFALGVQLPVNPKGRPKIDVSQALLSPTLDGYSCFDSPRAEDYNFSWRTEEEHGFCSPMSLDFGEAEAFGSEDQAFHLKNSLSESWSGKVCSLDRIESELEQSSLSEVTHDDQVGQREQGSPLDDNGEEGEEEGIQGAGSESTGDGQWEGVLKLVQELTSSFTIAKQLADQTENVQQKGDKLRDSDPDESAQTEAQAQVLKGLEAFHAGRGCCGISSSKILIELAAVQKKMEKIKSAVPGIASQKAKFTVLVRRKCAAAAGAIRLISQLTDAVTAIIPDIQGDVCAVPSESCASTDRCNECSPASPDDPQVSSEMLEDGETGAASGAASPRISGRPASTRSLIATSAASMMPVKPLTDESLSAAIECDKGTGSELRSTEDECASSLVANLLGLCDRDTESAGFAALATGNDTPFPLEQWGDELAEAIRTDCTSQSQSEELPFSNPDEASPSTVAEGGESDAEPTPRNDASGAGHDESDEGDTRGGEQLPLGSYTLMEIDNLEILTEQTHYCNICSKGFKRDANLRMHMRSHGGKYKSSAALIRSERPSAKVAQEMVGGKPTRYSCPHVGCNRNAKHPKFQALKTMLCLKNHYRRSHCPKTLQCSICKSKLFSVVADLKTHEKHCGSDKWACSCGTTFSRKEKLFGHVSLFVGHSPVDASVALNFGSEVYSNASRRQAQLRGDKDNSLSPNQLFNRWHEW